MIQNEIKRGKHGMKCIYENEEFTVMGGYDFSSNTVIIQNKENKILFVNINLLDVPLESR